MDVGYLVVIAIIRPMIASLLHPVPLAILRAEQSVSRY